MRHLRPRSWGGQAIVRPQATVQADVDEQCSSTPTSDSHARAQAAIVSFGNAVQVAATGAVGFSANMRGVWAVANHIFGVSTDVGDLQATATVCGGVVRCSLGRVATLGVAQARHVKVWRGVARRDGHLRLSYTDCTWHIARRILPQTQCDRRGRDQRTLHTPRKTY